MCAVIIKGAFSKKGVPLSLLTYGNCVGGSHRENRPRFVVFVPSLQDRETWCIKQAGLWNAAYSHTMCAQPPASGHVNSRLPYMAGCHHCD